MYPGRMPTVPLGQGDGKGGVKVQGEEGPVKKDATNKNEEGEEEEEEERGGAGGCGQE